MKIILQSEAAECSLASLAMIADANGYSIDLPEMRRRFPLSIKGAALGQIVSNASALSLNARPVRLELDELSNLETPAILHWNLNHFVVLKKVRRAQVYIADPAKGECILSIAEASKHFTGVAIEFSKKADFTPKRPPRAISLAQLAGKFEGIRSSLLKILLVAISLEVFAVCAPLLNQFVVDEVLPSHDVEMLNALAIGYGLILLMQAAISAARSFMQALLGRDLGIQWLTNVFTHLIRLPVDWFERRHLGDIANRFQSVHAIQNVVSSVILETTMDGIMVIGALAMMLLYSVQLAMIPLIAVAIYIVAKAYTYPDLRRASAQKLRHSSREQTHFFETLRAITPIRLFSHEDARRSRWQNLTIEVFNSDIEITRLGIRVSTINTIIFGLENILVIWLSAKLIMNADARNGAAFTIGMMFAFLSYKSQFSARVTGFIDRVTQIYLLRVHTERLADIALCPPEADTDGSGKSESISSLPAKFELRNVSFRYSTGEPLILQNINLEIKEGECVALIGQSGAGKTTLIKLLLGLLKPTTGQVLFGGIPASHLGWKAIRSRIGTVMQEDNLFTGTIAENVTLFDPEPNMARLEDSLRTANLHDEIMRSPMQYDTLIGDLGSGLSGGQRQRLLLARALYKQPSVLVLDEATSHLDVGNEGQISMKLAAAECTRLIIAHRAETIAHADRVLEVSSGKVMDVVPKRNSNGASGVIDELSNKYQLKLQQ